ncbi:MAG: anti-sigma F factor [Burkholderiales bacterium PBB4]|nr:MAG: anti-sigma F factor [Burkholderiales bacterium PBB4]
MKTDDLIAMLATGVEPVPPAAVRQRFQRALAAGMGGALALMWLEYGVRQDIGLAVALPMFWFKLAFAAVLAVSALVLVLRLGRPGMPVGRAWWGLVLPWLALSAYALVVLWNAPPQARADLVLGKTWLTCALNIALVSLPAWVAAFWALRGLAPTRPAQAGACAGLLAAAMGALAYSLHCPEMQAPFLAVWYVLGMLLPTAAGAALGPRLLRW